MKPICKPVVNTQLEALNTLQRTTESFRYAALSIEHWMSPEGIVREWLRKNLRWSALLVIPTLTAFPVVTVALWELEAWVGALTTIASKLIFLPILALLVLISITVVFRIIRAFKPRPFSSGCSRSSWTL